MDTQNLEVSRFLLLKRGSTGAEQAECVAAGAIRIGCPHVYTSTDPGGSSLGWCGRNSTLLASGSSFSSRPFQATAEASAFAAEVSLCCPKARSVRESAHVFSKNNGLTLKVLEQMVVLLNTPGTQGRDCSFCSPLCPQQLEMPSFLIHKSLDGAEIFFSMSYQKLL